MNKTIVKVFIILGILVLALLVWAFVFGNGLETIFNAIITPINGIYQAMTGNTGASLIPAWKTNTQNNIQSASNQAFGAGTGTH